MAKRKVETEFAYDIGDVVRLTAWNYTTQDRGWVLDGVVYAPEKPATVYQIVELLAQICEGGLQRKYGARPTSQAGNCINASFLFLESEIELADRLPIKSKETRDATKSGGKKAK